MFLLCNFRTLCPGSKLSNFSENFVKIFNLRGGVKDYFTSKFSAMKLIVVVCLLSVLASLYAFNAPIEDNDLGITARACAANFCKSKDSLELWMEIEYECHARDLITTDLFTNVRKRKLAETASYSLSSVHVGLLCSFFGLFGYYVGNAVSSGVLFGSKKGYRHEYTKIPTSDPISDFNSSYESSSGSYH